MRSLSVSVFGFRVPGDNATRVRRFWEMRTEIRGDAGMNSWPTGWRFWLLVVLLFAFPVALHPWWLFIISAAVYALLVRTAVGTNQKPKFSP